MLFPLLVLARTGDLLAAGILASINAGVAAVVGVLAGVVVDRFNRRTVSIVSDLLSSASIAALPVVDAIWGLDLSWFIVLSVIGTFGDTSGMTARRPCCRVALAGGKPAALDRLVDTGSPRCHPDLDRTRARRPPGAAGRELGSIADHRGHESRGSPADSRPQPPCR